MARALAARPQATDLILREEGPKLMLADSCTGRAALGVAMVFGALFVGPAVNAQAVESEELDDISTNAPVASGPLTGEGACEPLFSVSALDEGELAAVTGREQSALMLANAENTGIVADNEIGDNSITGAVNISDNAFSNTSGISMLNVNTGNASAINSSLNVNIQINYDVPAQ